MIPACVTNERVQSAHAEILAERAWSIASSLGFSQSGWQGRRLTFTSQAGADLVLLTDPRSFPPPREGEHDGSMRAIVAIRKYVRHVRYTASKAQAIAEEAQEAATARGLSYAQFQCRRLCFPSLLEADLSYLTDPTYLPPSDYVEAA